GGKKAVHREEHEVSRKAIAQGRPGCSACTCMLVCVFLCANCTRDRGCSVHPVFPAPSVQEGGKLSSKARTQMRREIAAAHSSCRHPRRRVTQFVARRSEAISGSPPLAPPRISLRSSGLQLQHPSAAAPTRGLP